MTRNLGSRKPSTRLDSDAIDPDSPQLLSDIANSITRLLGLKAALERKKALSPSLQTGLTALQDTLNSADGYLSASKLYDAQGMYRNAVDILSKGMKEVSSSNPRYPLMEQQLKIETTRLNDSLDIIAEAPYDLLNSFVTLFDQKTYYTCLQVNRTWRNRVLQCPGPWRNVIINEDYMGPLPFTVLPLVTHHIVSLTINHSSQKLLKCLELLRVNEAPALKELFLLDSSLLDDLEPVDLGDAICDTISVIGHQLDRLQLDTPDATNISLIRVLKACKNLTLLLFSVRSIFDCPTDADIPEGTFIRSISLKMKEPLQDASLLAPLILSAPRLRILLVDNCLGDFLPLIEDKCPVLEGLSVNCSQFDSLRDDEQYVFDNPGLGISHLTYSDIGSLQHLQKRLQDSSDIIRSICLAPTRGTVGDWQFLSTYNSSTLTHLYLDVLASPACQQCVVSILRNLSNLKSVRIDNFYTVDVPDSMFDAIASMQRLERLKLKFVDISGEGFGRLLNKLAERSPRNYDLSTKLELVNCAGTDAFVLMAIARIRSLMHLTIIGTDRDVNGEDIMLFSQEFTYMSRIYSMELGGMVFTDIAAQNISLCPYLRTMHLHNDIQGLTMLGLAAFHRSNIEILGPP